MGACITKKDGYKDGHSHSQTHESKGRWEKGKRGLTDTMLVMMMDKAKRNEKRERLEKKGGREGEKRTEGRGELTPLK